MNQPAAKIVIATNRESPYAIVIAANAPAPERFAAEELRKYLSLSTGSVLPVVTETDGRASRFLLGAAARAHIQQTPPLNTDGYIIKTVGKDICLVGGSPRATLYAVYDFLKCFVGCGWCVPGGDAVPRHKVLSIASVNKREEPAFAFRSVVHFPFQFEHTRNEVDWMTKNRLNWSHPCVNDPRKWSETHARKALIPEYVRRGLEIMWGGHTFHTWIPTNRYYEMHPEYFALVKGERLPQEIFKGSLCVANADLSREAASNIATFVGENPEIRAVDLWTNDTADWCECEKCARMEGETDYVRFPQVFHARGGSSRSRAYYRFANAVARHVRKRCPDVTVSPLAYFRSWEPPDDVAFEPNVLVGFTTFVRDWSQALMAPGDERNVATMETIRRWRARIDQLYIYEYFSYYNRNPFGEDQTNVAQMAQELRHYSDLGIDKISSEGGGAGSWRPLVMYAFAALAWNPRLSAEEIIADFCSRSYGAAAPLMVEFWHLQEKRESLAPRRRKSLALLARAESQADSVQVAARLAHLEAMFWQPSV